MSKPSPNKPRVSLTQTQLQEGLGAELFSLCQGITADGSLSKDEIVALGLWLHDNRNAPLPGIAFLSATLDRIIADGHVTRDEQRELILTGGRVPVPVIVLQFYRPDQLADIANLKPNPCSTAATAPRKPWWKFW